MQRKGSGHLINIHAVLPCSRVNGPGKRTVVFFQGCARGCAGCFNPDTHPFEKRSLYSAEDIFDKYLTMDIEGITVSGGEPFSQPQGLLELLRIGREVYGLTSVVYTGFIYEELKEMAECQPCLQYIDTLVDGAYEKDKKETTLLARGSSNQRFHLITGHYNQSDFYMPGKVEVTIGRDGIVTETGFSRISLVH